MATRAAATRRVRDEDQRSTRRTTSEPARARARARDEETVRARSSTRATKPKTPAKAPRFDHVRPVRETMRQTALVDALAERCDVDRRTARSMLDTLGDIIASHVHPRGPGKFVLPGVLQVRTRVREAVKGGKRVPNPFKPGETMITKSRPRSLRVKILPSRHLKEAANR